MNFFLSFDPSFVSFNAMNTDELDLAPLNQWTLTWIFNCNHLHQRQIVKLLSLLNVLLTSLFIILFSLPVSLSKTMSQNGSLDRRTQPQTPPNAGLVGSTVMPNYRLRLSPRIDHSPENYDDLQLEFNPLLFSSLEQYLPGHMLGVSREAKVHYMRNILLRYLPEGERFRVWVLEYWYFVMSLFCMKIDEESEIFK